MRDHERVFNTTPEGLSDLSYPRIQALGHRGSRIVYHTPDLILGKDPNSGLNMFRIESVFGNRDSVLIGCGTPNVAITVYDAADSKWKRMNAFMFYRDKSYVANTHGDLQVGVYFELRGLPDDVRTRLLDAMAAHSGERGPSCAHLNAAVLADAGFTLGNGKSLTSALRPSTLANVLWSRGLKHDGNDVDVRIVNTSKLEVGDHFVGVWRKEVSSPVRTIRKQFQKHHAKVERPAVPAQDAGVRGETWTGPPATVWVNRPTWFGVSLSFLWGRHSEYKVLIPGLASADALSEPLAAFPGQLSKLSKLKKYLLFSRPVVNGINHVKNKGFDRYEGVPLDAALEMLNAVDAPETSEHSEDRVLWNFALLRGEQGLEIRLTPLKNQDVLSKESKLRRLSNWILAKHVVVSGYNEATVFAGEAWAYRSGGSAQLTLCINDNSGTYQPQAEQLETVASMFRKLGLDVKTFPR